MTVPYVTYLLQSFMVPFLAAMLAGQGLLLMRFTRRLVIAEQTIEAMAVALGVEIHINVKRPGDRD